VNDPSLLVICATAFVAVMLLLSLLAGVIHVLMILFPEREAGADPALLAAVHTAAAAAYPGHRITGVEEVR
jgi:hypothetical protein